MSSAGVPTSEQAVRAASWDAVAGGYEELLVPRFAPWTETALAAFEQAGVASPAADGPASTEGAAAGLPHGLPIVVPCCGPGQELPPLSAAAGGRPVVGLDISPGMVVRAARRAAECRAQPGQEALAVVGDAAALPVEEASCAGLLSVFGLQQLPDPVGCLAGWCKALAPGGVLVVIFWPPNTEAAGGPWSQYAAATAAVAHADEVPRAALAAPAASDWPSRLAAAAQTAGCSVLQDQEVAHEICYPGGAEEASVMTAP